MPVQPDAAVGSGFVCLAPATEAMIFCVGFIFPWLRLDSCGNVRCFVDT